MGAKSLISKDKNKLDGLPHLRGTKLPVKLLKFYYRKGFSVVKIMELWKLTEKQVNKAIGFCKRKRDEKI
jgi:uncharacterized protein (DUF433 family)